MKLEMKNQYVVINQNLNRINQRPFIRHNNASSNQLERNEGNVVDTNARLCKGPKTLNVLWEEWTTGIAGMKAALLFKSFRQFCLY